MFESLKTAIKLFGIFGMCMMVFYGIIFGTFVHSVAPGSDFYMHYDELRSDYDELLEKYGDEKPNLKEVHVSSKSFYGDEQNYHKFTVDENKIEGIYRRANFGYVLTYFFDTGETYGFEIRFK